MDPSRYPKTLPVKNPDPNYDTLQEKQIDLPDYRPWHKPHRKAVAEEESKNPNQPPIQGPHHKPKPNQPPRTNQVQSLPSLPSPTPPSPENAHGRYPHHLLGGTGLLTTRSHTGG